MPQKVKMKKPIRNSKYSGIKNLSVLSSEEIEKLIRTFQLEKNSIEHSKQIKMNQSFMTLLLIGLSGYGIGLLILLSLFAISIGMLYGNILFAFLILSVGLILIGFYILAFRPEWIRQKITSYYE